MNDIEKEIKINGVKAGAILGLCLLVLSIISFYIITGISITPIAFIAIPIVFTFLIPIVLVLLFCFEQRKRIGGYWNLRQATTGVFIMFFVAYAIQTIGRDLVFAKFIEPDMIPKIETVTINATTQVLRDAKSTPQQIDKKIGELKTDFANQKTVTTAAVIQSTAISIIFAFVLSLIFGALLKREAPVYATATEEDATRLN